jgi:hypothetical protein
MGAVGLLRERASGVTREQAAILRLVLVCVAWAIGQLLATAVPLPGADFVVPAVLAIGVYIVTADLGRPRADVSARYWRGRRIDDEDSGPRRWN